MYKLCLYFFAFASAYTFTYKCLTNLHLKTLKKYYTITSIYNYEFIIKNKVILFVFKFPHDQFIQNNNEFQIHDSYNFNRY